MLTFKIEIFSDNKKSRSYQSFVFLKAVILEIEIFILYISAESSERRMRLYQREEPIRNFEIFRALRNFKFENQHQSSIDFFS